MLIPTLNSFDEWRNTARYLLLNDVAPEKIHWQQAQQNELFGETPFSEQEKKHPQTSTIHISKVFMDIAQTAACYRCDSRWALLYRVLWRMTHGEPYLLDIASDKDIHRLQLMAKEVRRDSHKMKAFVRFRKVDMPSNTVDCSTHNEAYIAWHQPSHFTLQRTAPFFVRRFTAMNWAILTPDASAYWDGKTLRFGEGVARSEAPKQDEMETLWKTFYWHIFNPARIKVSMMKSEMPMKFWHTLPEAELISDMLNSASGRVEEMIAQQRALNSDTKTE